MGLYFMNGPYVAFRKHLKMAASYHVYVLKEGYSRMEDAVMKANSTCTLIKGEIHNIIVDVLSPWDKDIIISGLSDHGLTCSDIDHVVCTHGHIDHVGNLNLFTAAKHIVGFSISERDSYHFHPFEKGEPYLIDAHVKVLPTPGHTATDVSVIVRNSANYGTIGIVGDLFEREEDVNDPSLWRETAGSENPESQCRHRKLVADMVDFIVPGHGKMFQVTDDIRRRLSSQI